MLIFIQIFCCSASSIDSPKIIATARVPDEPSTASLTWTSLNADVVDVNVYSGDTFSEVSHTNSVVFSTMQYTCSSSIQMDLDIFRYRLKSQYPLLKPISINDGQLSMSLALPPNIMTPIYISGYTVCIV